MTAAAACTSVSNIPAVPIATVVINVGRWPSRAAMRVAAGVVTIARR